MSGDLPSVVALSGGVGGARLARGLHLHLSPGQLACIVNTGDDFEHLGLYVCPDLDTVLYTLADCHNPGTGWGRRDETWTFMSVLAQLGGPDWFRLGDGDLALHVERTRRLRSGVPLSVVTRDLCASFGVASALLPMTEAPVRTLVHTREGILEFQDYFVRRRAAPVVTALEYAGATDARPSPAVIEALASPALEAIVVCPSNPWLSVDPILAVHGLREALRDRGVPVVAVCPLIGGRAVKGPTGKIMAELGLEATPAAIAAHYGDLLDGMVIDETDRDWASRCGLPTAVAQTLMSDDARRVALAEAVLRFARSL
ncbi:MAG: 2-phospho-L-lactate transferase [Steroidobacteraceae bacterium]|nr:2-phospho-L-lactate transferase [Steroidobacteraceae bacterium]